MLILDADALIKLYKAGVLAQVAETFECAVPRKVYEEAVTLGRLRNHPDADDIDQVIANGGVAVVEEASGAPQAEAGFGGGETAILDMLFSASAASSTPVVVSDDRAFLSHLGRISQPFVVPALLIVEMARQGALNQEHAREAMDRLRPFIRTDHYNEALMDLEDLI